MPKEFGGYRCQELPPGVPPPPTPDQSLAVSGSQLFSPPLDWIIPLGFGDMFLHMPLVSDRSPRLIMCACAAYGGVPGARWEENDAWFSAFQLRNTEFLTFTGRGEIRDRQNTVGGGMPERFTQRRL